MRGGAFVAVGEGLSCDHETCMAWERTCDHETCMAWERLCDHETCMAWERLCDHEPCMAWERLCDQQEGPSSSRAGGVCAWQEGGTVGDCHVTYKVAGGKVAGNTGTLLQ
jgi:hypothetical protein